MRRQLQIRDGLVQSEWLGSRGWPTPPDPSWTFVDATDRPEAQVGMLYDAQTDAFSPAPASPPAAAFPNPLEVRLEAIEKALDKLVKKGDA